MSALTPRFFKAVEPTLAAQGFSPSEILLAGSPDLRPEIGGGLDETSVSRLTLHLGADGTIETSDLGSGNREYPVGGRILVWLGPDDPAIIVATAEAQRVDAIAVPTSNDSWRTTSALFDVGFVRICTADAFGRSIAGYLRSNLVRFPLLLSGRTRGVAAMSRLGSNGRFANQLFQYAFLRLYALRHELGVETPKWDGCDLFGIADPEPDLTRLVPLRFFAFDDDDLALWSDEAPPIDVDFDGYFQELPQCWSHHREFLRRLFSPAASVISGLDAWIARMTEGGRRPLAAMHVRRGDYPNLFAQGLEWYRPIPTDWYCDWLDGLRSSVGDPVIYLGTDAYDEVVGAFGSFDPRTAANRPDVGIPAHLADFEVMRRADYLAVANSSFSRMAALLAPDGQKVSLPDISSQGFRPWEAWDERRFWDKFAPAGADRRGSGSSPAAVRQRSLTVRRTLSGTHGKIEALEHWLEEKDRYVQYLLQQADRAKAMDIERLRTLASTRFALSAAVAAQTDALTRLSATEVDVRQLREDQHALRTALFLNSPRGLVRRLAFRPVIEILSASSRIADAVGMSGLAGKLRHDADVLIGRRYREWGGLMRRRIVHALVGERSHIGSFNDAVTAKMPVVDATAACSLPTSSAELRTGRRVELGRIAAETPAFVDANRPGIVVVVPWLMQGGSEVVLLEILASVSAFVNISLITTLKGPHPNASHFQPLVREIHHLEEVFLLDEAIAFFASLCRSRQARLLFSSNADLVYQGAAQLKAALPDLTIVDLLHNDLRQGHFAAAVAAHASIDRQIVVGSHIAASLLEQGLPASRVVTIPNGIDIESVFDPRLTASQDAKRFFGSKTGGFVLGFVGRMSPEKRPAAFLDIVEALEALPDLRILMIGSGPLDAEIEDRLTRLARPVVWRRHLDRSEMPLAYAAMDMLVVPSTIEGAPLAVLEAMAMGVPVGATNAGNIGQIVDQDDNGFIVDVDRYMDLAGSISALARDPDRQAAMRKAARGTIVAKGFTRTAMLDEYRRIFREATGAAMEARGR